MAGSATVASGEMRMIRLNGLIAFVDGLKPRSELEAMIACQLALTHGLSMELLQRTKDAKQVPQFEAAGNMAAKMMRAFAMQVDALTKLRRGGEQTVRVEHVHVYPGGQAIVGTVTGGRGTEKSEHQPNAPQNNQTGEPRCLPFAPGEGMPSVDARGKAARSRRAELLGLIKPLGETAEMVTDQLCREA